MERNLLRRVETGFPIEKTPMVKRVLGELKLYLDDQWQSWELQADDSYSRNHEDSETAAQQILISQLAQ